jgi:hypothetical protein
MAHTPRSERRRFLINISILLHTRISIRAAGIRHHLFLPFLTPSVSARRSTTWHTAGSLLDRRVEFWIGVLRIHDCASRHFPFPYGCVYRIAFVPVMKVDCRSSRREKQCMWIEKWYWRPRSFGWERQLWDEGKRLRMMAVRSKKCSTESRQADG